MSRTPRLFIVPFDSGQKGLRMGAGPLRLRGEFDLPGEEIEPETEWRSENVTSFQLYRRLAARVSEQRGVLPVVLSGNCGACIGTAAGVSMADLAVIWFDAHGDFNTPETSSTGFLDGMGLSILTGRCFSGPARSIPGFTPLPFNRAVHVGGHDFDTSEVRDFKECGVAVVAPAEDARPKLDELARRARRLVVHVDMDVLDLQYGRANSYAAAGGMSPDSVVDTVQWCGERFEIAAVVIASFDPSFDADGRVARAAVQIAEHAITFC